MAKTKKKVFPLAVGESAAGMSLLQNEPTLLTFLYGGLHVKHRSAVALVRRRRSLVLPLCAFLLTEEVWQDGTRSGTWAPLHALHLLGAMADPCSIGVLCRVVRTHAEALDDWITGGIPSILAAQPPSSIHSLFLLAQDTSLTWDQRTAGSWGMVGIACRHPPFRKVVKRNLTHLANTNMDPVYAASLLHAVGVSQDSKLLKIMERFLDRPHIDPRSYDREVFTDQAQPWVWPKTDLHDPLDYFLPKPMAYLRKVRRLNSR